MGQCSSGFEWRCAAPRTDEPPCPGGQLAPQIAELRAQLACIVDHLGEVDRQLGDIMDELARQVASISPRGAGSGGAVSTGEAAAEGGGSQESSGGVPAGVVFSTYARA